MTAEDASGPLPLILVVEDEEEMRDVLVDILRKPGWKVSTAADGVEALASMSRVRPSVVLTDLNMPGMNGMQLLQRVNEQYPGVPVVVLTAYGSVPGAVEAMRSGAFDFLTKPPPGPDQLRDTIRRALTNAGRPVDEGSSEAPEPVHDDPVTDELLAVARTVAPRPTTVLLTGESGVGKEVLARYLHAHSGRGGSFVAINCAALPEALLESELFGHDKGAFTGADRSRPGRFEQAHGGTLLLDEIGEMAPALQAKLLRVLETRRVTRLGGAAPRPLDVRVLAATNRDLDEEVAKGGFREDLLYRLNMFPIHIPPLRERSADVLPLARRFLALLGSGPGRRPLAIDPDAARALQRHRWPGNVRELQNVIERAVILAGTSDIRPGHLRLGQDATSPAAAEPPPRAAAEGGHPPKPKDSAEDDDSPRAVNLEELERRAIIRALAATDDNRSEAAKMLGIARRTLHYKLKKYEIE